MSKIDYQALREKAEKATWGDWDSYKPHRGARGYEVRLSSQAIAQHVLKNNAEFIAAFNPKVALALLDELERNQQYIKRRDQENEEIALTVGRLCVELEAAERQILRLEKLAEAESAGADKSAASCVEWMKRCHAAEKRVAELESLTVPRLPNPAPVSVHDERAAFETFMEKRFRDCIDRRMVKNGDGEYFAWDMQVAWIVWQERASMLHRSEPETDNTNQQFESLSRGDK